jgi:hypothetical protein
MLFEMVVDIGQIWYRVDYFEQFGIFDPVRADTNFCRVLVVRFASK